MIAFLNSLLEFLVECGILIFEYIGVGVIICTSLVSLYKYVTRRPDTLSLIHI